MIGELRGNNLSRGLGEKRGSCRACGLCVEDEHTARVGVENNVDPAARGNHTAGEAVVSEAGFTTGHGSHTPSSEREREDDVSQGVDDHAVSGFLGAGSH